MKNNITLHNTDCLELMPSLPNQSIDVILTDPPYLYLKGQKLERPFDEQKFFKECKRVLTPKGFIVLFGRGTSFYRWNTILADLGFDFKEEIIWDKKHTSSPLSNIGRCHETISIHSLGGSINRTKVPYLDMKGDDIQAICRDIKRMRSILNNTKSLNAVLQFLEKNELVYTKKETEYSITYSGGSKVDRDRSAAVLNSIVNGMIEKTIIKEVRDHYSAIHPTQKPVRLLERLLALVIPTGKPRREVVVADFFAGSMSCMEAVYNMGFQGIACDDDIEYLEAGKRRIEGLQPKQQ
jgi:site-specific DNA-methyltransferase (adenine-specific)